MHLGNWKNDDAQRENNTCLNNCRSLAFLFEQLLDKKGNPLRYATFTHACQPNNTIKLGMLRTPSAHPHYPDLMFLCQTVVQIITNSWTGQFTSHISATEKCWCTKEEQYFYINGQAKLSYLSNWWIKTEICCTTLLFMHACQPNH